jgi:hypothetical protein
MIINKILTKFLTISFVLIMFLKNVFPGPPPGIAIGTEGGQTESSSTENKTKFILSIGSYKPSLNMINEYLKYHNIEPIGTSSIYTIGIGSNKVPPIILNLSYWSGSTKKVFFKETLNMYIFGVGGNLWDIEELFPKPYSDYLNLNLNFIVRDVFAFLKYENLNDNTYISYTTLVIDLGGGLELEFFPLKNFKNFSISLGTDFILLSLSLVPFEVWESNLSGIEFGDNYKNHEGKDMILETNGNSLKIGLNFYF